MVKNLGGNKAKKQARKGVMLNNASAMTQKVRYVEEAGEMYAVVTTIFGGKFCQVMCDDGVSRRCTIRRKFMTSRKGDNAIGVGTWAMVGLYDWEKRSDGSQTCDILEVYSAGEKEKLKQTVNNMTLKHIIAMNNTFDGNQNGNEFIFSDTLVMEEQEQEQEQEQEEDEKEEDEDDDEDEDEIEAVPVAVPAALAPVPVPAALAPVPSLKDLLKPNANSIKERVDWMAVKEDDI
jgi:hypothetical protein